MRHVNEMEFVVRRVAGLFARLPQARAVALGGSNAGGVTDGASDIDLYVFTVDSIPLAERQAIVAESGGASRASLGLTYWGPGDEWFDAQSGIEVDLVYFDTAWMEEQIHRLTQAHQASLGYSTCFWSTIRNLQVFHDPQGWLAALQAECRQVYPEELRRNIIALNHPLLRTVIPAYTTQLEKALKRGDLVSVNHRLAALLASYFDILFAFNYQLHPGEKRLVQLAQERCAHLPEGMAADIQMVLQSGGAGSPECLAHVHRMLDRLDALLGELPG